MGAKRYPLTHPQKRIWYTEQINQCSALHNITGSIRIRGPLDYGILEQAIDEQKRKHDALRLRIEEVDGTPAQYAIPFSELEKDEPFVDFSSLPNPETEWQRWVEETAAEPFSLDGGPLCSFPTFRIAEDDGGFLIKIHHIASDGWSSTMLIDQIRDAYERIARGEQLTGDSAPSYLDHIQREAGYLESARFNRDRAFWGAKFAGWPEEEPPPASSESLAGKRKIYMLDADRSNAVKHFLDETGCSLSAWFHFLIALYNRKTAGQAETVIGMPVFNRTGQKEKATAGMFTSTMPLRIAIDSEASITDELIRTQKELTASYYHQKYPYDLLISDLQLKKRGIDGLFDISVNVYNTKVITEWAGASAEVLEHHCGSQSHSLQLVVKDWLASGELKVEIDFKLAEFSEAQIDRLFDRLTSMIDGILASPDLPVGQMSILLEPEKERLAAYLSTQKEYPRDKTVMALFKEQAQRTPDRVAAVYGTEQLTYRQLDERSDRLSAWLSSRGIGRECAVGLFVRHSLDTVVAILAVLKAGAAYVPIDPDYPVERIGYMLGDADCGLLLANVAVPEGTGYVGPIGFLDDPSMYTEKPDPSSVQAGPDDLAYIIYTSGSTGKPKGVMIEHRGLVNYIWWAKNQYTQGEDDVFPLYSSLAFDLTVTSVFTPLIAGGRIDIYRDDQEEYVLERMMKDNRATVVKLTPSHLSLLLDRDNRGSSIRQFIVGGEDLRTDLAKRIYDSFGGRIEICNEYGPTETVVGCMIHRYDPAEDTRASVPIGIPAANVGLHLLDRDGNPVPEDVLGEIYITGDGLARGYRNLPQVTEERFVSCPFLPGERMYRTGDLARRLESGVVEYAGRADLQVKIRGHRIELGEIERMLAEHPSVREAVVIDRQTNDGSKFLCGYVVREQSEEAVNLTAYLSGCLPSYMVPAHIVELPSIPLNVNGKVDRGSLPAPELKRDAAQGERRGAGHASPALSILLAVARDVLQDAGIAEEDHFYSCGGDSIKAIQLASRLRGRGFAIKVSDVLANPVFADMADCLRSIGLDAANESKRSEGGLRSTPILDWFLTRPFTERHHYVQSVLLRMNDELTAGQLEKIIRDLVNRHDSLRLKLDPSTGAIVFNDDAAIDAVSVYDLSDGSAQEQLDRVKAIGEQLKSSFKLDRDALLKACIFELGQDSRMVLLTAHHLAVDAVSWSVLMEEFGLLYRNIQLAETSSLPSTTTSYQRWAEHLWGRLEDSEHESAYWKAVLADELYIRHDADGQEAEPFAGTVKEWMTQEETEQLLKQASAAYGTNTQELLAAALAAAVQDVFAIERPVVELEGHGREPSDPSIDLSRTVGWFTTLYPVRLQAVEGEAWETSIKSIKETLRSLPSRGLGFGLLTRLSRTLHDPGEGRRIRFNYVGELDSSLNGGEHFTLSEESSGSDSGQGNRPTAPLDIVAMVIGGRLQLSIGYDRGAVRSETATDFAGCFAKRTKELIRHCCSVRERNYTPSDFATISLSQEALDSLYL
ncbi:amino acid adenylation domain protein [Paenibacillus curdlanolyticus YK9]|uniref:Amino acid adenylation domain protein n=1 Tax=Paenibacillus curdlanolyticus YK9 TaxID=717606 RepID=E0IG96_9BACL|nr:non-ribosomal peptide synthetase [Paenibacillus curdlanolyticus]EFM08498.1 amino acid adenylation domain protein [Paenibacillus curdlanolyticus YK9]